MNIETGLGENWKKRHGHIFKSIVFHRESGLNCFPILILITQEQIENHVPSANETCQFLFPVKDFLCKNQFQVLKLQVPKMITSKINKSSNISLPNLEDSNPKYLKVFCGGKKCKKCTKAHSVFIVRKREFYWSLSFILELSSNVISDSCPSNLNPCKAFCFIIFL